MQTPKLLYHGTAMMSLWASCQQWRALAKLREKDPQLVDRQLRKEGALAYYRQFGPIYPHQNYSDLTRRTLPCLVRSLAAAWIFAHNWEATYFPKAKGITFRSGSRFHFSASPNRPRPINEFLLSFGESQETFFTPGAILVFDGYYLQRAGLLMPPSGEEDFRVRCLPWQAMRGVLQVSAGRRGKIDGYILKDREVAEEMMEGVGQELNPQGMFKPEIWQKFTVGRGTLLSSLDMFGIEG